MARSFLQIIDDCPENVRAFVCQTHLVNEHARILREIEAFSGTAICMGYDLTKACANARAAFSAVSDGLDQTEKVA